MLPHQKHPLLLGKMERAQDSNPSVQSSTSAMIGTLSDRSDQYAWHKISSQRIEASKPLAQGELNQKPLSYSLEQQPPRRYSVTEARGGQFSQMMNSSRRGHQQAIGTIANSSTSNMLEKKLLVGTQSRQGMSSHPKQFQTLVLPPPPTFSSHKSGVSPPSEQVSPIKVPVSTSQVNKIQYPQMHSLQQSKSAASSPASVSKHRIFNDDDPITDTKTPFKELGGSNVVMELSSQYKIVHLGPKTIMPTMCSLHTHSQQRTSTDLICVIDTSGSMAGTKLNLLVNALLYLLKQLNEQDRICLITFNTQAERLCPLKTVSVTNKPYLMELIKGMFVGGGTNIMKGISLALKTLKQRKYVNTISSIFLLSDGQDSAALPLFKNTLSDATPGIYSLHSFGFGDDHDPNLMTEMAKIKQGNFYYIQQLNKIDEAFVNALGALISIAIEKITIRLSLVAEGKFSGIHVSKVYGDLWKQEGRDYVLELTQLISNISKDFVFQLTIPPSAQELGDFERNQTIINARFQAITPSKEILIGGCQLNLTFFNHYESLAAREQNKLVVQNHLRVLAAECMDDSMRLASNKRYNQARSRLQKMSEIIRSNSRINQGKMRGLLEDIRKVSESCAENSFESFGTHLINHMRYQHMAQNNMGYSNITQTRMNTELELQKQHKQQ